MPPTTQLGLEKCKHIFAPRAFWRIVSGDSKQPTLSSTPTETQVAAFDAWQLKSDKAAGYIYLAVEDNQKVHFANISDDPVKMCDYPCIYTPSRSVLGARFNAYDDLFSIRKLEDESLQSLMNRVDTAIHRIQDLRPKDFTLTNLDDELASMTLIRALPDEFSGFASSLLLLDKLEKSTIQQAFVSEESQRRHRASATPNVTSALAATSSRTPAASTASCEFCGRSGHVQAACKQYKYQQDRAKNYRRSGGGQTSQKAHKADESDKEPKKEFAGNASALSTSAPTGLQSDADLHWLADTGATSHMTPHYAWMRNYTAYVVDIHLADNTIVQSAGIGSVVLKPCC